jgi:hypothetical protein
MRSPDPAIPAAAEMGLDPILSSVAGDLTQPTEVGSAVRQPRDW